MEPTTDFHIREACLADASACAQIHIRSWEFAYGAHIPAEIMQKYNAARPAMWQRLLKNVHKTHYVIEIGERVIGFFTVNPPRDPDLPKTAYELTGLYLDPDFIGKGCGRHTMEWIKREIFARGYRSVCLWVLDRNDRAKAFYQKCGFLPDGSVKNSGLGVCQEERWQCPLSTL